MPPGTFYFIPTRPWISAAGEVTHIVALLANAERREMMVYFELFNAAPISVLLPYSGTEDTRATYAVDVLTGTEAKVTIDEEAISGLPWQATHELGDSDLFRFTQSRIERLIRLSQERAFDAEAKALLTRAFGDAEDRPLTPADLANGIAELIDYTLLEWQRPAVTLAIMEEQLKRFNKMVRDFEEAVPDAVLPQFRDLMSEFSGRLMSEFDSKRMAKAR